jgi:hypothetical protein
VQKVVWRWCERAQGRARDATDVLARYDALLDAAQRELKKTKPW